MKRRSFFLTALTAGLSSRLTRARGETARKSRSSPGSRIPRIMFTHDSRHPAVYMYEPPMEREEFEAAVDELAGTPVDALMFGLADGRTFFHDTKVGEIWGDPDPEMAPPDLSAGAPERQDDVGPGPGPAPHRLRKGPGQGRASVPDAVGQSVVVRGFSPRRREGVQLPLEEPAPGNRRRRGLGGVSGKDAPGLQA